MIRPDYREILHYGMPRRSGRYPWGSGDRPYQSVSSSAAQIYKQASEKEKIITKDVKEAAKKSNCKLYGLENSLKSVDSIQRKMDKKQIENGKTKKESVKDIQDSVRYTTISDTKNFVSSYENFKKRMIDLGYTEINCKNYFEQFKQGLVKHKSVQSNFSDKDGFIFEVQFQTPESQDVKTKKIPLYEERRKVNINPKRAKELENKMEKMALTIPDPPGIEKIKSHTDKSINHSQESEVKFKMNNLYYLSHGGPGSGRYPLGSGDRPYQKFEGSRRRSSGISGYINSIKAKKAEAQLQKQKNEELRRKREEQERKRQHDADKERVLKSGTASEVLKYQGELTNQELQNAFTRLNLEAQLRGLSQREIKTAIDKVDSIMKTVKTGTEWVKIGTDTYNTIAKIYNVTESGKSNPLTIVGSGGDGKKK